MASSSTTIIKWQLILYFLRFIFCLALSTTGMLAFIFACINDLYILIWDIYTYGSLFASVTSQILVCLVVLALNLWAIISYGLSIYGLLAFPPLVITVVILIITANLWRRGPAGSWMLGVKDLQKERVGERNMCQFVFGKRRPANDEARKVVRRIPKVLTNTISRRIEDVESIQFAITRNIVAIFLLGILVIQSVRLFHGVISEQFSVRENWLDQSQLGLGWDSYSFCDMLIIQGSPNGSLYGFLSSSDNSSTEDALAKANLVTEQKFYGLPTDQNLYSFPNDNCNNRTTAEFVFLTNLTDKNLSPTPGPVLLSSGVSYFDYNYNDTTTYENGIYFMFGHQRFGVVEVVARRFIEPAISDMIGFNPFYVAFPIFSIDWMERTSLNNASIARVTLQFASDRIPNLQRIRVIEDYRQHTFLNALSSIGGLLAVLQGLHVLLFGRPLFWGMFGSKFLNPFGIFGSGSSTNRRHMIDRYGFNPDSSTFTAEGLSMFLGDFVFDVGPLKDRDEDGVSVDLEENREVTAPQGVYEAIPLQAYDPPQTDV